MKKSEIKFTVELDKENVPEKIVWEATDKPTDDLSETKAVSISIWDHVQKNTLRIDLWAKEMPVTDMKRFYVDILGGLAQSLRNSTGDEKMYNDLNALCDSFVKHIMNEIDNQK